MTRITKKAALKKSFEFAATPRFCIGYHWKAWKCESEIVLFFNAEVKIKVTNALFWIRSYSRLFCPN